MSAQGRPPRGEDDQDHHHGVGGYREPRQTQRGHAGHVDGKDGVRGEDEQRPGDPYPGWAAQGDEGEQPARGEDRRIHGSGSPVRAAFPANQRDRGNGDRDRGRGLRSGETARACPWHQPARDPEHSEPHGNRHRRLAVVMEVDQYLDQQGELPDRRQRRSHAEELGFVRIPRRRIPRRGVAAQHGGLTRPAARPAAPSRLGWAGLFWAELVWAEAGQHRLTRVPSPGADVINARPSRSAMRSMMDRRRPSRAGSTRAGSNPAPASRTVTWRPSGAVTSPPGAVTSPPGAAGQTSTQASPVPAWAATFASASRTARAIATATGTGTAGTAAAPAGTAASPPRPAPAGTRST